MNDVLMLVPALAAGLLLGGIFFGGLWWTVHKAVISTRPARWLLGSLLLRTVITLAGLYLVSGGHNDRLLICLLGFVIARFIVTRLSGRAAANQDAAAVGASHAP